MFGNNTVSREFENRVPVFVPSNNSESSGLNGRSVNLKGPHPRPDVPLVQAYYPQGGQGVAVTLNPTHKVVLVPEGFHQPMQPRVVAASQVTQIAIVTLPQQPTNVTVISTPHGVHPRQHTPIQSQGQGARMTLPANLHSRDKS